MASSSRVRAERRSRARRTPERQRAKARHTSGWNEDVIGVTPRGRRIAVPVAALLVVAFVFLIAGHGTARAVVIILLLAVAVGWVRSRKR